MLLKRILRPDRLRQIPASFSWVDHRLVREQHLQGRESTTWALYLFLVTVADVHGLSYYSDAAIGRQLRLDLLQLASARKQLIETQLIAYQKPLYQVLALPERASSQASTPASSRSGQVQSVADILRQALAGGSRT
jgi:hypothetical protein